MWWYWTCMYHHATSNPVWNHPVTGVSVLATLAMLITIIGVRRKALVIDLLRGSFQPIAKPLKESTGWTTTSLAGNQSHPTQGTTKYLDFKHIHNTTLVVESWCFSNPTEKKCVSRKRHRHTLSARVKSSRCRASQPLNFSIGPKAHSCSVDPGDGTPRPGHQLQSRGQAQGLHFLWGQSSPQLPAICKAIYRGLLLPFITRGGLLCRKAGKAGKPYLVPSF